MLDLRVQCREWAQSGFGWDRYRQTVLTSCILHGRLAFSTLSAVSLSTAHERTLHLGLCVFL